MNLRRKTILPIGNRGLTFIEVMVALAIFSFGITAIFQSFLVSLEQLEHFTSRLYASTLLDNRIATIEHMLRAYRALPLELNRQQNLDTGPKEIVFKEKTTISEVEDYADVFEVDVLLTWQERQKEKKLSRSAYISDFDYYSN